MYFGQTPKKVDPELFELVKSILEKDYPRDLNPEHILAVAVCNRFAHESSDHWKDNPKEIETLESNPPVHKVLLTYHTIIGSSVRPQTCCYIVNTKTNEGTFTKEYYSALRA